ncbi:MAG: aspartate/tyrosine/aromatic aminotransferase [Gammaproteobacteria bacterium]|nr:aspartate/tyrosine/aromatic aminotransferase [Gammaproteobacteria bacterium]
MFESIEKLPADPILGLTAAFEQDPNPKKIDLGAGVYKDETGRTPIFEAVREAQRRVAAEETTKVYISQPGYPEFNSRVQKLIFGENHAALKAGRVSSVMTPGGCGALRLGAELINRSRPGATIWVSQPTWANHVPLLGSAGLKIREYPYYNGSTHAVEFDAMLAALRAASKEDIVLLHACCHNPTGADLDHGQWDSVAELAIRNGFLPFVDFAYQGLGDGLDEDAYGPRCLVKELPEMLLAYSCSKNFGLYRERIGALVMVARDAGKAEAGLTHMTGIARGIYSMPPSHGGAIVKTILGDAALLASWKKEVDGMRRRINDLRVLLADTLARKKASRDFGFIRKERGMFSFLGVSKEQVQRLRREYGIYMVDSSRINVAGLSPNNIDYLTDAVIAVL